MGEDAERTVAVCCKSSVTVINVSNRKVWMTRTCKSERWAGAQETYSFQEGAIHKNRPLLATSLPGLGDTPFLEGGALVWETIRSGGRSWEGLNRVLSVMASITLKTLP
jgi:hypothetical protein